MAKATLTWTANTEADLAGYKIYRAINSGPMSLLDSVGKVTTYVDEPLPNIDGVISYTLSAIDTSANESGKTAPKSLTVNTVPPATPTGLEVVLG